MTRLFNLDAQLLFDAALLAISMFVLFTFLSYVLFKPVRKLLNDRKEKVAGDQMKAKANREQAENLKKEYESHLREVDKEAEQILGEARKKAKGNEAEIVAQAKEEAAQIIARANTQVELEKKQALDDMKQEMISVASMMAGKVVAANIDTDVREGMVDETLQEIGESTWQS